MWQSLYQECASQGLDIVAVALDRAEAARPWIEAAGPTYPCLIDERHRLAELYHITNVPQSVWIDETGRIVRPTGSAGSSDGFREMDRKTGAMPQAAAAERAQTKNRFVDAVRDWVARGAASPWALPADAARARLPRPGPAQAEAHAWFQLALALAGRGRDDAARDAWRRAQALHPGSWAIYRQLAEKDGRGLAVSEEFWSKVDALGAERYHVPFE